MVGFSKNNDTMKHTSRLIVRRSFEVLQSAPQRYTVGAERLFFRIPPDMGACPRCYIWAVFPPTGAAESLA